MITIEIPYLRDVPNWWNNFVDSIKRNGDGKHVLTRFADTLEEWHCTMLFTKDQEIGDFIIRLTFENDEYASWFILKYS
jgi:hypothetical protein